MAQQYDSSLLKTLIQLAAHSCHFATDTKGLGLLADELEKCRESKDVLVTARYLRDLSADIKKALQDDTKTVSRGAVFINILLNFLDFSDWKSLEQAVTACKPFFPDAEKIAPDHRADCIVLFPETLNRKMSPLLAHVQKQLEMELTLHPLRDLSASEIGEAIPKWLEDHQAVFWVLTSDSAQELAEDKSDFSITQLVEEGKVIPVYWDENPSVKSLLKLGLKKEQLTQGKRGLLLGIYYLYELLFGTQTETESAQKTSPRAKTHIGTINNDGVILMGDGTTVSGEQVALGNFTQNINNDQRKISDSE